MFTTYPVTKKLQPYVSFYYDIIWERKDYENDIRETVLPSGKGFMVFQHQGRFRGMMDTKEQSVPKYYTIGQQTKTYTLFSDHETNALTGVAFKPTGLYHFFGQNMSLLTNTPADSKTVLGSDLTHFETSYEKELRAGKKVELVEQLLLDLLEDKKYVPNFIDIAIDMMDRSLGCEPITKVTKKLNVSERYFQKKFKEVVGIAPSVYNRMVRFNNLFSQIDAEDQNNYKTLVALFNYYDLAHFSKDFKKYCGESPKKFHLDKFKFVKEAFVKNPIFLK
ncbi:AraC family transcriptional regulator [Maribacter sp. ANRC-HE7]|uniref:AraC family transcriptional regulator n=1 Tax=Maribacter aquimaris TaxID=2737171 RepID=A0ABR7V2H5_9FLAO|nr:helix-turn-helix domain-containing protein [Maribacter aquimaris]MBD0777363.1 AraC family transcriptional regulator [Maribacter aquimaris]